MNNGLYILSGLTATFTVCLFKFSKPAKTVPELLHDLDIDRDKKLIKKYN